MNYQQPTRDAKKPVRVDLILVWGLVGVMALGAIFMGLREMVFGDYRSVSEANYAGGATEYVSNTRWDKSTTWFADFYLDRGSGQTVLLRRVEVTFDEFNALKEGKLSRIAMRYDGGTPQGSAESEALYLRRPKWLPWASAGVALLGGVLFTLMQARALRRRERAQVACKETQLAG